MNQKISTPWPIYITLKKSKSFINHAKMIDFRNKYDLKLDKKIMRNLKNKQLWYFFCKYHKNLYSKKNDFYTKYNSS